MLIAILTQQSFVSVSENYNIFFFSFSFSQEHNASLM